MRMRRTRTVIGGAILVAVLVLAVAEDEPSLLPLLLLGAAFVVLPRRKGPSRPMTRGHVGAAIAAVVALTLTLLMPDGTVRWVTIAVIAALYLVSFWLLGSRNQTAQKVSSRQ